MTPEQIAWQALDRLQLQLEQEREKLRVEREAMNPLQKETRRIEVRGPKGNKVWVWNDTGEPCRPFE